MNMLLATRRSPRAEPTGWAARLPASTAAALAFALITAPVGHAMAHEGHDHDDEPRVAAAPADSGPRAVSHTEGFEVVAVMEGETLTVYLDEVDTNEPVRGAKVEIDSGAFKGTARMQAPGVYTVAAPLLAKPGHHPMTVSVATDGKPHLMNVSLASRAGADLPPGEHDGHHGLPTSLWAGTLAVGAALATAVVLGLRVRSRPASNKAGS